MVSVVAFLTVTNIALGYGLAIYVHRHFGTLVFKRGKLPQCSSLPDAGSQGISVAPAEAIVEAQRVEPFASQPQGQTGAETVPPAEQVEEEQVLAGIEEFRSQLAKMNEATNDSSEAAPEATAEPVAAAN